MPIYSLGNGGRASFHVYNYLLPLFCEFRYMRTLTETVSKSSLMKKIEDCNLEKPFTCITYPKDPRDNPRIVFSPAVFPWLPNILRETNQLACIFGHLGHDRLLCNVRAIEILEAVCDNI